MIWAGCRGFLCPQVSALMSSEGWSRENPSVFAQMSSLSLLGFPPTLHALTVSLDELSRAENYWFNNISSFKGKLIYPDLEKSFYLWNKTDLILHLFIFSSLMQASALNQKLHSSWDLRLNITYLSYVELAFRWHFIHFYIFQGAGDKHPSQLESQFLRNPYQTLKNLVIIWALWRMRKEDYLMALFLLIPCNSPVLPFSFCCWLHYYSLHSFSSNVHRDVTY